MKKPPIGRILLLASVILVITQSVSSICAQTVLFNADFSNTTGDNAWTNSTGNTSGNFTIDVANSRLRNTPNNYAKNTFIGVESPSFDLSNYSNITLDLDRHIQTQAGNDGAQIQYSIGGGAWTQLGTAASGFYNDTDVDALGNGVDGWSGFITAFTAASQLNLSAINPAFNSASDVRFRILFASDNNQQDYGVAFRNIIVRGTLNTPQPEIAVFGSGMEITDGDPSPNTGDDTDFGTITAGTSQAHTFTITNSGTLPLSLSGSAIQGTNSLEFTITTPPPATIAVGGSADFVITYNPSLGGTHNATFTVNNNDLDENPYNFSITGTAIGPQPEISLNGQGNIINNGDTTTLTSNGTDYGASLIAGSITRSFNIANSGDANLNLTGASPYAIISGSPYFSVSVNPASSITAGGFTTFDITYNPTLVGTHTATVTIANNDSDENPFIFTITGQGVATLRPEIDLSGNGAPIADGDTTPSTADDTDFNNVFLGSSDTNDFTINNTGTADLVLNGAFVEIVGGSPDFAITSLPSGTIEAGNSSIFQVTYTPSSVGTHTAIVRVRSNDNNEATYDFTVQGSSTVDTSPNYTIYYEGFDTDNGSWVASNPGGNTTWTYGSNGIEPGTEGGYWYTNNYANYAPNSNTYATSPTIDLTGYHDLKLQIDIRHRTVANDDGMRIEYYDGTNWNVLGAYNATPVDNWYNSDNINSLDNGNDGWSGINAGGAGSGRSDFIRSSISLPSSLNDNPSARLRVLFRSNGSSESVGVNFDNVVVLGNPIVPFINPSEGPGNITSNLKLWLKSDIGTGSITSGNQITTWNDLAYDNNAIIANNAAPIYYNNATENINHNPVIDFNTSNDTELKGKGGYYTDEYWVVIQSDGTINSVADGEGVLSGRTIDTQLGEDGTGLWINPASIRFRGQDNILSHMIGSTPRDTSSGSEDSYGRAYVSSTDSMINEVLILNIKYNAATNQSEIYRNGKKVDNYTGRAYNQQTSTIGGNLTYSTVKNSNYALGVGRITIAGTPYDSHFNGKMTEFASYNAPNSLLNQKKIQSYLALKNGVTLHSINSTTATRRGDENYIDSDGTIIWETAVHNGFTYDIAGIGRDNAATLNQKQSTSSNPGAIVTMGLSDIYNTNSENIATNTNTISDKNFLIWGNNNGSFAAASAVQVDLSSGITGLSTDVDFTSIQRTWKVVEKGSVGLVKISVPEASLSATITPPGNFLMFISDTPSFSPTSEYRIMYPNGVNLETTYDFDGEKYITFGYAPEYIYERSITFDGTRDYMDADDVADLTGPFTISTWVKPGANANNTDIISKSDFPFTEGYALRLTNALVPRIVWRNTAGTTEDLTASIALPQDEWHHIAVIYDGNMATFYIDGIEDTSAVLNNPVSSDQHFLVAATNHQSPTNFFDGTIDEVRVWNQALSQEQLQFIMNQEIEKFTDDSVNGKIIPQNISKNEVASIPWADLEMYLPMSKYTFTNVKDESDNNHVAAIKNLQTVDFQTAPLPYVSSADGVWANTNTWTNGDTQALPGAPSLVDGTQTIDWNIVQTAHNVSTASNNTVLALDVNTAELTIGNDSKIEVSHYLKLDGVMDLVGESQLIQTENSDLAATSSGRLERDQQGTSDTYSYNIWSSPVGPINITDINEAHTVASIMNDGTDENNPQSLNFSTGYNGANSTPKTVSAYWLYTYRNDPADTYSAWDQIGPYGTLETGDGFTMKGPGSGAVTDPQNYVFIGKPNNGTDAASIDKTINAGNDYLMGNPFPSALDANKFINDNPHLTGTLSFWEHWGGGNHFLADYEAGYALYTLGGGTPAVSHPAQNTSGASTNTPTQFIAVGQGFFVRGATTGTTSFNNTQRVFAKEASSGSFFFNGQNQQTESTLNAEDEIVQHEDLREKFRIGFDSPSAYHRQLLMTIDENTTFGYDRAYDAVIDNHPQEDMMWMLDDEKAIILGVPSIENDRKFPLRIGLPMDGEISIGVDALENVNTDNTTVYLFDALQDTYTDITIDQKFTLTLEAGTYLDRFYIVLEKTAEAEEETEDTAEETDEQEEEDQDIEVVDTETIDDAEQSDNLSVYFNSQSHNIIINKRVDYDVQSVQLFTMLGQLIKEWTPESETTRVELPVQDISTGAYIIKVQKLQTTHTQKLIIH